MSLYWNSDAETFAPANIVAPSPYIRAAVEEAVAISPPSLWRPWRVRTTTEFVDILADFDRVCPVIDPTGRELMMTCGATLYRVRSALSLAGGLGAIQWMPDLGEPELVARFHLNNSGTRRSQDSSAGCSGESCPVTDPCPGDPDAALDLLCAAACKEASWLEILRVDGQREQLADLVVESDQLQMAQSVFRRELSARRRLYHHASTDPIPERFLGFGRDPDLGPAWMSLALPLYNVGRFVAEMDRARLEQADFLAVLKTRVDDQRHWLFAGQALVRIMAEAQRLGLSVSLSNQVIQCPETRCKLRHSMGRKGFPQAVLRLNRLPVR